MTYTKDAPADILPGCYYPGCDEEHGKGEKFCPEHGGKTVTKKNDENARWHKASTQLRKQKEDEGLVPRKTKPKKTKTKPKAKAKAKAKAAKAKRTNIGAGNGTAAQKKAAKARTAFAPINWAAELEEFRTSEDVETSWELGSNGSANVSAVRLRKRVDANEMTFVSHFNMVFATKVEA